MRRKCHWLLVVCFLGWGCAAPKAGPALESKAISLNESGYEYYRQSRWHLAQLKFDQALKINRLIDRRAGIAANLNNLGVVAQERGEVAEAIRYFQEALEVNRELQSPAAISETLNNLGVAYQAQGRLRDALAAFQEAREWDRGLPPGPLPALTLTHLGDVARSQKDYSQALNYYHQALMLDEGQKDRRGRAMRWERLGRTFLELRDYDRAAAYIQDALREFRLLEDTGGIVDCLKDLTQMALARGDRREALLQGELLLNLYRARGQEREAEKLEAILPRAGGV